MSTMLYPELFKQLEAVRWSMDKDIPWDRFDATQLSDEQAQTIKMNAITEWAALPATEMFLRDNRDDSDFSAFMSVWFFEEQKPVNQFPDVEADRQVGRRHLPMVWGRPRAALAGAWCRAMACT